MDLGPRLAEKIAGNLKPALIEAIVPKLGEGVSDNLNKVLP
jgi:hypothetical protein